MDIPHPESTETPASLTTEAQTATVLVVDDSEITRQLLCRQLQRQGHRALEAHNGFEALAMLKNYPVDVVLLDIVMPMMSGIQVLEHIKEDEQLRHIPVIVISALDDMDSVTRCIEMGAEDYLFKPYNPAFLRARLNAALARKRFHDKEQAYLQRIQEEHERAERLLLNILPAPVAARLKEQPHTIANAIPEASVLFADIVDFTPLAAQMSAEAVVELLNRIFSQFDALTETFGLEKIKTIGDAYMVVGGVPRPRPDHLEAIADMALAMQEAISHFQRPDGTPFRLRIGINTGPVVAGVIGQKKFIYDLWGDAVNLASRMESQGIAGEIQVTETVYRRLKDTYLFETRGELAIKGGKRIMTYLLKGKRSNRAP